MGDLRVLPGLNSPIEYRVTFFRRDLPIANLSRRLGFFVSNNKDLNGANFYRHPKREAFLFFTLKYRMWGWVVFSFATS